MLKTRVLVNAWIISLGILCAGAGGVWGQDYPTRPIRIVLTGVGGGADLNVRLIAQSISGPLGQQVIVDNRPSGVIAADVVAKAAPDGYTLLSSSGSMWITPLLQHVPYEVSDFAPITITDKQPNMLAVHPSLPAKSVRELIALAKASPGKLNYGSSTIGSTAHLAAELFKAMAGVNIVRIPYKSLGPAVTDLIGGQVDLMFAVTASLMPHVKSGRLRALAVTTVEPSVLAPGLPTVAASGLPGYQATSIYAISAPLKTAPAIISRLHREIVRVLNLADVKQRFLDVGSETVGSSPEELGATIKSEMTRLGKVIKDAGIKGE